MAAGIGFGYEQEIYKGISLIPFVGVDYNFSAKVFSLDTPGDSENELSGDTLSHFNIQYGGLVTYKSFYAGYSAERYSDTDGLHRARLIVGLAFGGGKKSAAAPAPRPRTIRATDRK